MDQSKALTALSALAHAKRLEIVRLLMPRGCAGLNAGDIGAQVDVSASRLSFHLSALESAGLITSRRESRNVFYTVAPKELGQLMHYLLNDCCCAHPDVHALCTSGKCDDAKHAKPLATDTAQLA